MAIIASCKQLHLLWSRHMCVFRYIELGVGSPTLFNPEPAPFLLCFGLWKCGKILRVPLISQGTLCQIRAERFGKIIELRFFTNILRLRFNMRFFFLSSFCPNKT